jgi:hypothetical protein
MVDDARTCFTLSPGNRIGRLLAGRSAQEDTQVLKLLRRVLREARAVAKADSAGNPR